MDECDHIWIVDEYAMDNTKNEKILPEGIFLMRKVCSKCSLVRYDKCKSYSNKDFLDRYFSIYTTLIDNEMPGKWFPIKNIMKRR